jgi:NAD-dependent SIR2 family protein deacetylase
MTTENVRATRCGVPWPVCPRCLGEGLHGTAGRWRCPRCGSEWADAARVPCPDPAVVVLTDLEGRRCYVCASHASHPSVAKWRRVEVGEVTPANDLDGKQ